MTMPTNYQIYIVLVNPKFNLSWTCVFFRKKASVIHSVGNWHIMFVFGEGPTTRSSIHSTKSEAFSTPVKYITRASLHRENRAEDEKSDVKADFPKSAKPKEGCCGKLDHTSSSSVFSEKERNLSSLSDEGFGSPTTILPAIPSILARPRHQLSQEWSLWYNRGSPGLTWAENQKVNQYNTQDMANGIWGGVIS